MCHRSVTTYDMSAVAWFLQIPPNPHSTPNPYNTSSPTSSSPSTSPMSKFSSLFARSSSSPSGDIQPRQEPSRSVGDLKSRLKPSRTVGNKQKPPRTVSWDPTVEALRRPSRAVTWAANVEVFIIPARDSKPDDYDLSAMLTRCCDDPKALETEQDTIG